jgi:hypothetical protein
LWAVRAVLHRRLGDFSSLRVSILRAVLPRMVGKVRRRKFSAFLEQIASLEKPYRPLLLSHVVMAAQLCVIGMSLGLLASLEFYHFLSEDIRFGWSMTRDVQPETVHSIVSMVAAPWSAVLSAGLPTLDQVLESRLSREMTGKVVSGEASRAWASFLTLAILTYGVLLRLGTALLAGKRASGATESPVLEGPQVDELIRRMTSDPDPEPEGDGGAVVVPPSTKPGPWWKRFRLALQRPR